MFSQTSCTRIFDNVKYMHLSNDNELKKKSLEDNVYFTLRDIFMSVSDMNMVFDVNEFSVALTNDVSYEDRTDDFQYSSVLYNETYLTDLIKFLHNVKKVGFDFDVPPPRITNSINYNERLNEQEHIEWYYNVDMIEYIEFDEWYDNFNHLIEILEQRLKDIKSKP